MKSRWFQVVLSVVLAFGGVTLLNGCGVEVQNDDYPRDLGVANQPMWSNDVGIEYWPSGELEVCFQPYSQADYDSSTWYAEQTARIQTVVEAAYESIPGVDLDFTGWNDCDDWDTFQVGTKPGKVRVLVRTVSQASNFAYRQAQYPADIESPGSTYANSLSGYNEERESVIGTARNSYSLWDGFDAGILHEFGHLLGFSHEFNRADNTGTCETGEGNDSSGRFFTIYDDDSIMSQTYCGGRPSLTLLDELGVEIVYPTGSPLNQLAGTVHFTSPGGLVFREDGTFTTDWIARGALPEAFDDDGDNVAWQYLDGSGWHSGATGLDFPVDNLPAPTQTTAVQAYFYDFAGRLHWIPPTSVVPSNSAHAAVVLAVL